MLHALLLLLALASSSFEDVIKLLSVDEYTNFVNKVNTGSNYSGTTVYLGSDITLNGSVEPIGINSTYHFLGTFDGQGHIISNLKMNSSSDDTGLFGFSAGLTIRNVVLDGSCSIKSTFKGNDYAHVGGIVGYCYPFYRECNIENTVNMADITFSGNTSKNLFIGGIVGILYSSSSYSVCVKNCVNYGSVTHSGTVDVWAELGGIAGISQGDSTYKYIQNCLNYGTITHNGTSANLIIGGIVGVCHNYTYIENCVSAGKIVIQTTVSGTNYIGSIVGYIVSNIHINYCYHTSDVNVNSINGTGTPSSTIGTSNTPTDVNSELVGKLNINATSCNWNKWFMLHLNGGNINNLTQELLIGIQGNIPNPVKEGNTFLFWCKDPDCNNVFDPESGSVTGNIDLYAAWVNNTVTFNVNGGDPLSEDEATKTVSFDEEYGNLPEPNRAGYTFAGWFNESDELITNETIVTTPKNHTLHANWTANNYTVTFNVSGGDPLSVDNSIKTVIFDEKYGELPEPSRAGYTFAGWFNENDELITNETIVTTPKNHTLHANWTINNYTVTFNVSGGDELSEVESSKTVTFSETYGELPEPNRVGYTFTGWFNESDKLITNETIVTTPKNHTLHANWTANNYNVTFNVSGGDELSEVESSKTVTFGEAYGELPEPNRVGHTFTGWFNESDKLITDETVVTTPKNHTLHANWTINNYNVTFNFGNGTTVNATFTYNTEITYPDNSSTFKEGYTLSWDNYHDFMPAGNITVTAQWTANNYTVTFNVSGGEILPEGNPTKNVTFNEEYGDLPEPKRTGYTFTGWFNENDEFTNETTIVTTPNNHDLHAEWIANTYIVTLDADGGGGIPTSKPVVFDSAYGELQKPNRTGYMFAGWFTETPGGDPVNSSTIVSSSYDHKIYAHWTAIQYTISFDPRGGSVCENITQDFGTPLSLPKPEMTGYTFLGWFYADLTTKYTAKTVQADNITLYAKWEANTYNVSFDDDCGIYSESMSVTFDGTYNLTEIASGKPVVLWWEVEETGEMVVDGDKVRIADDITLCAVWKTNTVTLDASGGDVSPATINATYNETYGDLPIPKMDGYTFLGWFNESDELITNDTIIKIPQNHTLYAHWTAINYTITFDFGNGKTTKKNMVFGKSIEYPENTERDGYTFTGWVPELSTVPAGDITVVAQWEPNAYTVTFDVDGGDKDVSPKAVTFDSTYGELSEPERTGHTFAGWADSPFNGNKVSSTTTVRIPSNHTLYALWTTNQYVVTFNFGNGKKTPTTQSYGDVIIYPSEVPSKSFHKFRGWCTKDAILSSDGCNVTHVPSNDLTFTATFDVDPNIVTDFSVAIVAVVLVVFLLVVILVLVRVVKKVGHEYESIGIELEESDEKTVNRAKERVEVRIFQQVVAMEISNSFAKTFRKSLKKVDKNKGLDEILADLGVECDEDDKSADVIESFRTNRDVQTSISNTAHKKENLVAVAEYLSLLYTTAREQEEYEEFDELYFGMKNIGKFLDKMDEETISFCEAVSGLTSKRKAIQFLMQKVDEEKEDESNGKPSGVLFKVKKGRGYRIGELDEETDEVLFEVNSVFRVESIRVITKNRFIAVGLSFISPTAEDEMIKM